MKRTPKVTIAIFNFNGYEDTRKCLRSVLKTNYPNYEIYLLDDGSVLDEIGVLRREFRDRKITFFSDGKNRGFSFRANQALKNTNSKYVVLLNNDTVVDKDWLAELVSVIESDRKIGVCQSKLLSMRNPQYFEYAGGAGGQLDMLGYPYVRGRVFFHTEKDVGQYDTVEEIFWACGAAMMIRREVVESAGYFDVDLFAYVEEQDFCWRVKKAGYKVVSVPQSVVYHKGMGLWSKQQARKIYLIHRNNLIVFLEHVSVMRLLWAFPLRLFLELSSVFFYFLTRRFDFLVSSVQANLSVILWIPKIVKKRRMKNYGNKVLVEREMFPISLVWRYFLRGDRRYSDIHGLQHRDTPVLYYGDILANGETSTKGDSTFVLARDNKQTL